jgi:hypothetical protein
MALLEQGEPTLDSALKALRSMKYNEVRPQEVPELLARLQAAVYAQRASAATNAGGGLSGRARFLVGAGAVLRS